MKFDAPWEGEFVGYVTVIQDRELYRLYYRGMPEAAGDGTRIESTCYAVSTDGVHFKKPNLGLFEVQGTRNNNVILWLRAVVAQLRTVPLRRRPDADPQLRYKALGGTSSSGLVAFASADGIHCRNCVMTP